MAVNYGVKFNDKPIEDIEIMPSKRAVDLRKPPVSWDIRLPEKDEQGNYIHQYGMTTKGTKWATRSFIQKVNNKKSCWQCKNLNKRGQCETAMRSGLDGFRTDKYFPDPLTERRCVSFRLSPSATMRAEREEEGVRQELERETPEEAFHKGFVHADLSWMREMVTICAKYAKNPQEEERILLDEYKRKFREAHESHDVSHQKNNKARQYANSWLLTEKTTRLEKMYENGYYVPGMDM